MITKRDLMFSDWEYEVANQRIEQCWGNYIYKCYKLPQTRLLIAHTMHDGYLYIELNREASEDEYYRCGMTFKHRGKLTDYF